MFDTDNKPYIPIVRTKLIWAAVCAAGLYVFWDLGHALIKVLAGGG